MFKVVNFHEKRFITCINATERSEDDSQTWMKAGIYLKFKAIKTNPANPFQLLTRSEKKEIERKVHLFSFLLLRKDNFI